MTTRNTIIAVLIGLFALGIAGYLFSGNVGQGRDERAVRSLIADFGKHMQKVSLLASDASSTIATEYAPFVSPDLIAAWQKDPTKAPGRTTSSPWPDHIEITQMTPQGAGYIVQGAIILMTSNEVEHGGNAGIIPVYIQVVRLDGKWQIVAYQEVATVLPTP